MKQNKFIFPIIIIVGIGAAMSVALDNTAVGWAIGIAVAVAFAFGINRKNNPPENQ